MTAVDILHASINQPLLELLFNAVHEIDRIQTAVHVNSVYELKNSLDILGVFKRNSCVRAWSHSNREVRD